MAFDDLRSFLQALDDKWHIPISDPIKKTLFFFISYTVNKFPFGGLFGSTLFVLFANDFSV